MTELEPTVLVDPAPSSDPRRVGLTDLVARLAAGLAEGARRYEAAAGRADGTLREALGHLAQAKRAQTADLAPLARALGVSAPPAEPADPFPTSPSWGVVLAEAFQAERGLERLARELAPLGGDPLVGSLAGRLAMGAAQGGAQVRKLYLRYS